MEMEFNLLALTGDIENIVKVFLDQYSSNPADRKHLIETLLTEDVFDIDEIEPVGEPSMVSLINKTYFKCLGLELEEVNKELE